MPFQFNIERLKCGKNINNKDFFAQFMEYLRKFKLPHSCQFIIAFNTINTFFNQNF